MQVTLDFSSQLHYLVALLPEAVLSLGAVAVLLADVFARGNQGGNSRTWVRGLALATLAAAAVANVMLLRFLPGPSTQMIALDAFAVGVNFVFLGTAGLSLLFAFDYLEREGLNIGEFYFLIMTATVGMMLLAASRDLIPLFISLELMSLSVYVLVGARRRDPRSAEAALKYFLMGAFASAFLLYGIALLFGATGSTNLSLVGAELVRGVQNRNPLLLGGVSLVLVGFAFKVSAVPFHMWTPDAYEGAPTPVTGFMAAGVKAAGFAAVLRVITGQLAPAAPVWQNLVWWLAVLTMVLPNLVALAQDNVKRMLAYSSVAHAGYLLVGVAVASRTGRAATLFYVAVYAVMTLGAFAVVAKIEESGRTQGAEDGYTGLGWRHPFLGALLGLCLLSLAGFPPTGGFIGKFYLLTAAIEAGETTLAVVLVLSSLIAYYYYLRVVWRMYFEEEKPAREATLKLGLAYRVAGLVTMAGILASGLLPGVALRLADRAGGSIDVVSPAAESADIQFDLQILTPQPESE